MNGTHTYMQTKYSYTQKIKINKLIFLKERKLELKKKTNKSCTMTIFIKMTSLQINSVVHLLNLFLNIHFFLEKKWSDHPQIRKRHRLTLFPNARSFHIWADSKLKTGRDQGLQTEDRREGVLWLWALQHPSLYEAVLTRISRLQPCY